MYRYNKTPDGFELVDLTNGKVLYSGKDVAICFDRRDGTLLRHGDPNVVRHYFDHTTREYCAGGVEDIAQELVIVRSYDWPIEELNKCLDITGYVIRMVKAHRIDVGDPVGDLSDQPVKVESKPMFEAEVTRFTLPDVQPTAQGETGK